MVKVRGKGSTARHLEVSDRVDLRSDARGGPGSLPGHPFHFEDEAIRAWQENVFPTRRRQHTFIGLRAASSYTTPELDHEVCSDPNALAFLGLAVARSAKVWSCFSVTKCKRELFCLRASIVRRIVRSAAHSRALLINLGPTLLGPLFFNLLFVIRRYHPIKYEDPVHWRP
ncbi:hypothetical protein AF71_00060390 [Rhizobium sp. 57MFTsu3.2]|nr:hypothetical protein [Rhizobium sp. 57MFTsu3.2]